MWPVPFIQINWIGLSVGQMFYISLDWIVVLSLVRHIQTCSLTDSFIHSKSTETFVVREWTRHTAHNRRRLLFRPFKVYIQCTQTHRHILQACYYFRFSVCLSLYRAWQTQAFRNQAQSVAKLCEWGEEPANMRYDENVHVPLISVHVHIHSYRLTGSSTHSQSDATTIGTYVKLKHIVHGCGVHGERAFHSQSHHCHSNCAAAEQFGQHWATFRGRLSTLYVVVRIFVLCFVRSVLLSVCCSSSKFQENPFWVFFS